MLRRTVNQAGLRDGEACIKVVHAGVSVKDCDTKGLVVEGTHLGSQC